MEEQEEKEEGILSFLEYIRRMDLSKRKPDGSYVWSLSSQVTTVSIASAEKGKCVTLATGMGTECVRFSSGFFREEDYFYISDAKKALYWALFHAIREKTSKEIERRKRVGSAVQRFIQEFTG